VTSFYPRPN